MDRRVELEDWIGRTRQTQRRLALAIAGGAVVAIGLALWWSHLGMVALGIVVVVAVCGFWVTSSHIADWRGKLEQIDPPPRSVGRRS